MPIGLNTRISASAASPRRQSTGRFHSAAGMRMATATAIMPSTANTAWVMNTAYGEPSFSRIETIIDADSTMTEPDGPGPGHRQHG